MAQIRVKCPKCEAHWYAEEGVKEFHCDCLCVSAPSEHLVRPAYEWDKMLGTHILDWDGFGRDSRALVTKAEFEQGSIRCTQMLSAQTIQAAQETEKTDTGAVRSKLYSTGKKFPVRFDLLFRNNVGLRRLAETWGEGFEKYGLDNWKRGFPESVLINHALEHIERHLIGDTSEDHLAHAAWNLLALCWEQENKPELLDLTGATAEDSAKTPPSI